MKKKFSILFIIAISFISCMSTQYYKEALSHFERGDYPQSAHAVLNSLKKNPKNQDAQLLLEKVYPRAIESLLNGISKAKSGDDPFRWSKVADSYAEIHGMNRAYELLPTLYHKKQERIITVEIIYYQTAYDEAREKAAEEHYQKGLSLADSKSKETLREAISHFEKALFYVGNYKDSSYQIDAIEDSASDYILILPQNGNLVSNYRWQLDEALYNDILSEIIRGAQRKRYLKIVDRKNLNALLEEQKLALSGIISQDSMLQIGELSNADTLISYSLQTLNYSAPSSNNQEDYREFEYAIPESSPEYNDYKDHIKWVSGTVYTNIIKTSVELKGIFTITNIGSSEIIDSQSVTVSSSDTVKTIELSGDEEVLASGELDYLYNSPEDIKSYAVLVQEAEEKLAEKLSQGILKNFE